MVKGSTQSLGLTRREIELLKVLRDKGQLNFNRLYEELKNRKVATHKYQVRDAIQKLKKMGLIEENRIANRIESQLTDLGEAYLNLVRAAEIVYMVSTGKIDEETLDEILNQLNVTLPREKRARLIQSMRHHSISCKTLVRLTTHVLSIIASFLAIVEMRGYHALKEPVLEIIKSFTKVIESSGCTKEFIDNHRRTLEEIATKVKPVIAARLKSI